MRVLWQKVGKTPAAGGSKQVARAGAFAKSRENARRRRKSNRSPERAFLRKARKTPAAGGSKQVARAGVLAESQENARRWNNLHPKPDVGINVGTIVMDSLPGTISARAALGIMGKTA